jgi:hypothetical protein
MNVHLEDFVFSDVVCLLLHRLSDMQGKINNVGKTGKKVGLSLN